MSETTYQGVGSRMCGSFGSMCCGIITVPIVILIIFWNEGNLVKADATASEVKDPVEVPNCSPVAGDVGKLIFASCSVTAPEIKQLLPQDLQAFVPSFHGSQIEWDSEIFQWQETSSKTCHKGSGTSAGGETCTTRYTYRRDWDDTPTNSQAFHDYRYRGANHGDFPPGLRSSERQAPDYSVLLHPSGRPEGAHFAIDNHLAQSLSTVTVPIQDSAGVYQQPQNAPPRQEPQHAAPNPQEAGTSCDGLNHQTCDQAGGACHWKWTGNWKTSCVSTQAVDYTLLHSEPLEQPIELYYDQPNGGYSPLQAYGGYITNVRPDVGPRVGDIRIKIKGKMAPTASVAGQQVDGSDASVFSIDAYPPQVFDFWGRKSYPLQRLEPKTVTKAVFEQHWHDENNLVANIIRIIALFAMIFAFECCFSPISVSLDMAQAIDPCTCGFGSLLNGLGQCILNAVACTCGCSWFWVFVCIAWIVAHPSVALIGIVVISAGLGAFIKFGVPMLKAKQAGGREGDVGEYFIKMADSDEESGGARAGKVAEVAPRTVVMPY